MANYRSKYTGAEIDERLDKAGTAVAEAKTYTNQEIEKLRQEIPSGGITEEEVQEILAQIPDEVSVTEDVNALFPDGADIQIVLEDEETPPVDGVFAEMVKAALNKETWTFTLEDGTTVQKVVYVG